MPSVIGLCSQSQDPTLDCEQVRHGLADSHVRDLSSARQWLSSTPAQDDLKQSVKLELLHVLAGLSVPTAVGHAVEMLGKSCQVVPSTVTLGVGRA